MKIEIKNRWTGKVIFSCEAGSMKLAVKAAIEAKADLREADLSRANLRGANLREADLSGADLREADLSGADLRGADLRGADLSEADLREADLSGADLREADLREADLREADLSGADLDYSCWPLWCGSNKVKVDKRIAAQLAAHFCAMGCDDKDYQEARKAILKFALTSHRAEDLELEGR
ncbi:MAG: pentapeptide repeat-containing protein [Sphaerochaeta sp.]|jgi:uncharacterized protein YjbI with pentapeptide repeats|nr:pentapeptide repeat-containing protein [Sphaerochaeta sp.]